jgi:galacturan 1,4-alpha-galacturonidase
VWQALTDAWASACGGTGKQTIVIPMGDYLVGALNFTGPCTGDVTFQLDGNLLASTDLSQFKFNWIEIMRVENLVIIGKGKLDGQGAEVWSKNSCAKKYDCKILPNTLVLDFCNNTRVSGITLLNAKFFYMNIFQCHGVTVEDVTVSAPGDSPNTDGIHMCDSSDVTIPPPPSASATTASPSARAPAASTSPASPAAPATASASAAWAGTRTRRTSPTST